MKKLERRIRRTVHTLPAAARRWGISGAASRAFRVLLTDGPPGLIRKLRDLAIIEERARPAAIPSRRLRTMFLLPAAIRRWGAIGMLRRTAYVLRAAGPSGVISKLRELKALEAGAPIGPALQANVFDDASGILHLGSDFGIDVREWQRFLSHRAQAIENAQRMASKIWIVITGPDDSVETVQTCRSVKQTGLENSHVMVAGIHIFSNQLRAIVAEAGADDLIWFLRAGDMVDQAASKLLAQIEAANADLCLFDTYFVEGGRAYPQLHPGFNAIFGLNCDYFRSRFIARVAAVRCALNGAIPEDAYALARSLISARCRGERILGIHLPHICVQIEESHANLADESRALIDAKTSADWGGQVHDGDAVRDRKTSVIICTRDNGNLLRQLARSIFETSSDFVSELLIVSHHTTNPYALKNLADLRSDRRVRIIQYEGPFNFSRQCNLAAREATAPYLLFLNDDMAPVTADWLTQLLLPFNNPSVGMTGPLLLYPNERVQHTGMFLGFDGLAGHTLRAAQLPRDDYLFMTQAPREVSCLTGAAMVIERQLFDDLNGFDPLLGTYLQDVDLSLRVGRLGRRLVFNPRAVLLHMETITLRETLGDPSILAIRDRERHYFTRLWAADLTRDPFHNPNLDIRVENLRSVCAKPRNIWN